MQKEELYYQVAHSHLQEQDQRAHSLELRASGAMALGVALLGLTALVVNTSFTGKDVLAAPTLGIAAACGLAFIAVLACGISAQRPSGWRRDPDLAKFKEYLPQYADDILVEWAGDQFQAAVVENEKTLTTKAMFVGYTFLAVVVLVICVFALTIWSKA